jgi:hypothetical protein
MTVCRAMLCLLLLLPPIRIAAEAGYTIEQVHFLPPTYFVGDEVEVRIRIAVKEGFVPAEPSELPAPSWVHIRDVRIIPISSEYDIRISFSSYDTGTGELPPIALGDITLEGVEIGTESMLSDDTVKIEESFGPALLPGTRLLLALGVGALLIVPVLGFFLVIWIRKLIKHIVGERKERRPFKKLTLVLNELANSASPANNREFYIRLTEVFREYLSSRLEMNLRGFTASELENSLTARFAGISPVEKISTEFARFDAVKFGSLRVNRPGRNTDIRKIRDAAEAVEVWRQEGKQYVDP